MRIAIIGAGLAGLTCAAALLAAGYQVELFDKGRRPGGRMSTRRTATPLGEASFDHGAQYFSVRDAGFRTQVERWQDAGLVAPWPAAGADCWVGTPAMDTPVRDLASQIRLSAETRIEALAGRPSAWTLHDESGARWGPFGSVLLAVPAENAAPLLQREAPEFAARAWATPAQPCWTVMAAFAAPVPLAADILREDGPIGWASRNSAKPGRRGPEAWVIQAAPGWSQDKLECAPEAVVPELLAAFAARVGSALPPALSTTGHRWRFARSGAANSGALWDSTRRLGVCGDWLLGPRVECAWLSGRMLARLVAAENASACPAFETS